MCTRFGDCEPETADITVRWSIQGQQASASTCAGIDHLQVDYLVQGQDIGGFSPVSCAPGLLHFDRLPASIDGVLIYELGAAGNTLNQASGVVTPGPQVPESADVDLPLP
jgi:hypothetical protein